MRTSWEAGRQDWEIFIADPLDPALEEFEFPATARGWLEKPERRLETLGAVAGISLTFHRRLAGFVVRGLVQANCSADEGPGGRRRKPGAPRPPGRRHYVLLGPDWIDFDPGDSNPPWLGSVWIPLEPACPSPPAWGAFPDLPDTFSVACEQLSGVGIGAMIDSPPVILPCQAWPLDEGTFDRRFGGRANVPDVLAAATGRGLALQNNYYGVLTVVIPPGRLAFVDANGHFRLASESPVEWLARELEEGPRGQPSEISPDTT